MIRRCLAYTALGFLGGALAVTTAGLGYVIHDWQRSTRFARRTATAYGRTTK